MSWTLPKPMLTTAVNNPDLTSGWAAEPKWDGSPDTSICLIQVHLGQTGGLGPVQKWRGAHTV
ncbi:hypothetical protein AB0N88_25800 [Streptomyces sp. NPDC093516]|uniref:hypothetical protein n=1 Tax=Streptomyces sp. NPDC093516 TaxID=3155304 RepID=UPI0034343028